MTRVTENSSNASLNFSVGKSKSALEDLQIKGSNLKRIQKPSDDPSGNSELMTIKSRSYDTNQYLRNVAFAKTQLNITESSLADLNNILMKVKEIAIAQSSNYFNGEVREGVAYEVDQLRRQALGIANKRIGNRHIFSGHKTLTRPFDSQGKYSGDEGKMQLEINKDVFVPINLTGKEVFFYKQEGHIQDRGPLENTELSQVLKRNQQDQSNIERQPATRRDDPQPTTLFDDMQSLANALRTNNHKAVQILLEKFDHHFDRLNSLRARVGSLVNTVDNAEQSQYNESVIQEERKSTIEDADVAKLFSDLQKQKNVLTATYKSGSTLISQSLLDFLR